MSKTGVLASVASGVIGLAILMVYFGRADAHDSPSVPEMPPIAGRSPEQPRPSEPSRASVPTVDAPHSEVILRSSLGLGASRVRLIAAGAEEWHSVQADGLVNVAPPDAELQIPGHYSQRWHGEPILELTPMLGIVLQAPGLKDSVVEADVVGVDANAHSVEGDALLAGFVAPDRFAVAIDGPRYLGGTSKPLVFALRLTDGNLVRGAVDLTATGTYDVDVPVSAQALATVSVDFACEAQCTLPKVCNWWAEVPSLEDRRTTPSRSFQYPWGTLSVSASYKTFDAILEPANNLLAKLREGETYGVGCVCEAHGRYGRAFFVARNGLRVTIPSMEGFTLDCAIEPDSVQDVSVVAAFYPSSEYASRSDSWHHELQVPVQDGHIALRFPRAFDIRAAASNALPPYLRIRAKAATCDDVSQDIEWTAPLTTTTLAFVCTADFVLHARDLPVSADEFDFLLFLDERGGLVRGFVSGADESDGVFRIRLAKKTLWDQAAPRPASLVASCYSQAHGYVSLPFIATADGYEMAPTEELRISVEDEASQTGGQQVYIGWTWRGICAPVDVYLAGRSSGTKALSVVVPVGASNLWWATHENGPQEAGGGAMLPIGGALRIP